MLARGKIFTALILVAITTLACLSEIGAPTSANSRQVLSATPTYTASAIPSSATGTLIFAPPPPAEMSTPVFIPSSSPVRLTFLAEDGRQLVGYFYPAWKPNAPVVVLMHQFEANQAMWQESPLIKWLQNWPVQNSPASPTPSADGLLPIMPADLSFAVFTFDFRGHGESLPADIIPDGYRSHADELLMDARAAYRAARQMPNVNPSKIIGLGTSIGGDAVVDTCGEGCVGAFSISPGSWLNVDYGQAVQDLIAAGKPVRCMYSVNDPPTPTACSSVSPGEYYKIFGYPGQKHGMTFVILPRKMEADFGAHLLDFLTEAIR